MVTSKWSLRKCHQMFQTWNNSLTCLSDWPIGIASSWLHLLGWPVMSSWLCFLEWPLPSPWFCLIDWPLKSCCTSVSGQQSCDYFMYYQSTPVQYLSRTCHFVGCIAAQICACVLYFSFFLKSITVCTWQWNTHLFGVDFFMHHIYKHIFIYSWTSFILHLYQL